MGIPTSLYKIHDGTIYVITPYVHTPVFEFVDDLVEHHMFTRTDMLNGNAFRDWLGTPQYGMGVQTGLALLVLILLQVHGEVLRGAVRRGGNTERGIQ